MVLNYTVDVLEKRIKGENVFTYGREVGSWGLMGWLSNSIESHIRTRGALQVEIEALEKTIERLRDKTWQVDLYEDKNGKFVVMPEGEPHHWERWEFRGRPAWRLKDK